MKGFERGIIWEYNTINNEWSRGVLRVKVAEVRLFIIIYSLILIIIIEKKAFGEGLSYVHHVEVIGKVHSCKEVHTVSAILGDKIIKALFLLLSYSPYIIPNYHGTFLFLVPY